MDTYFRKVAKEMSIQQPETQQEKNKTTYKTEKYATNPTLGPTVKKISFEDQTLDKSLRKLPPETQQI